MRLKTFFNYYGGKWRMARTYPTPQHDVIIEPFAGAAGYSLNHAEKQCILYDKDPVIIGIWQWLIQASKTDVLSLPVIGDFKRIEDIDAPQGAKDLIGFCLNAGPSAPCKTPSAWARARPESMSFWSAARRQRVSEQVGYIKHWQAHHINSYSDIPNRDATWFIDPPYYGRAGSFYTHGSGEIDYAHLAQWCLERRGLRIVCESPEAKWLPFQQHGTFAATTKHGARVTKECVHISTYEGEE